MTMGEVIDVGSEAAFGREVDQATGLVVVHFWAEWCEPCKQMDEAVRVLAKDPKHPRVKLLRVEAERDELEGVTEKFEVSMVPHIVFLKQGKVVDTLEGADPKGLFDKVALHSPAEAPEPSPHQDPDLAKRELNARLKRLTTSNPVVLFMKGSPDEPRCGFSKKAVKLLQDAGAEFGHFDILTDQEVRQGLKEYSNWPTYPQLYVNGELLGGYDIMQEMSESGELAAEVKPESIEDRLKRLIESSRVMLFIKGDKEEPRCGFSAKVVKALDEAVGTDAYQTFDILKDQVVRQELKTYSNWPTYPQLYVKGELIGGCDIILDMANSGELKEALA